MGMQVGEIDLANEFSPAVSAQCIIDDLNQLVISFVE